MDLVPAMRGRVRIADSGHSLERSAVGDDPRHPGYRALRRGERDRGALRDGTLHAVRDLVRCVRDGGEPGVHAARTASAAIDAGGGDPRLRRARG